MKKTKKGAIELSVTTIIVIIIGVVLLGLGITFVTGVFKDAEKVKDGVFDQPIIPSIDFDKVYIPQKVTVPRGETKVVDIYVENIGNIPEGTYEIKFDDSDSNGAKVTVISSDSIKLKSGDAGTFRIAVSIPQQGLQSEISIIKVAILENNEPYSESGFIVEVE